MKHFAMIDTSKYYIAVDALREGGLYSYEVYQKGIDEIQSSSAEVGPEIHRFLTAHGVKTILAYNSAIPEGADCFKTGKLKRGYGVECILRMLGKDDYSEIHNALTDAMDELEIVRLLGHPVDMYPEV